MKIEANILYAGVNRWNPRFIKNAGQPFMPGTEKPEQDYLDCAALGRSLGIPVVESHLIISLKEPGKKEREVYRGRSRTFTRNFWNNIYLYGAAANNVLGGTFGQGCLNIKDTGGTNFSANGNNGNNSPAIVCFGPSAATLGTATVGIVVGTGAREEWFNAANMHAQVGSGNGAGQLLYSAQNAVVQAWDATTDKFTTTHTRVFNNNSGGTIVVREVGIQGANTAAISVNPFLMVRDLLAAPVSVVNAAQLTVTYQISLTFPAGVVNDPPIIGGSTGGLPQRAQGAAQVIRSWQEQRDPRNWRSTEDWQRYIYRNFKQ